MTKRRIAIWSWITAALGLILVLLMAGQVLAESVWLGRQMNTTGSYSYMPLYLGALVGVALIVNGSATAVTVHRDARTKTSS